MLVTHFNCEWVSISNGIHDGNVSSCTTMRGLLLFVLGLSIVPLLNNARNLRKLFPVEQATASSDSTIMIPHEHQRERLNVTETGFFSSCLLTMDDNHFLTEWIAYHYHALPLRRLIVAVDPNSKTSPSYIFDRWRKYVMTIEEWNDTDFMTGEEKRKARKGRHSPGTNLHRFRQRAFYARCMKTLKKENHSWTLLIDTDEYLTLNSYTHQHDVDVERPATMMKFLKEATHNKTINLQPSPCIMLPRLSYGGMESTADQISKDIPNGFNGSDFVTQRFRKHGPLRMLHGMAKTIIDLSRVNPKHISVHQSPHRPIFQYCPKPLLRIKVSQSPLVVRHYVGTFEQFSFRDDARTVDGMKTNQTYALQKNYTFGQDDAIRPWLKGFVDSMGTIEAMELLEGVGNVSFSPILAKR